MTRIEPRTTVSGARKFIVRLAVLGLILAGPAGAAESYSPYAGESFPRQVYWGDTHVHTNLSADSVFTLTQDDAYRFARGETITSISGQRVSLKRPLDFVVLAEHGKNMGAQWARHMSAESPAFRRTRIGQLWAAVQAQLSGTEGIDAERVRTGNLWPSTLRDIDVSHPEFRRAIWGRVTEGADLNNSPGVFTALIGYEYTPFVPAIHRVLIFRDGAERANQVLPFTAFDSEKPEDLWRFMERYEAQTGGAVLAIPHNSNLTSGTMFKVTDSNGEPLDRAYAESRSRWEPLAEATQIKGDSETHPALSPDDEFADFETWNGWSGKRPGVDARGKARSARPDSVIQYEYLRSALKLGLRQEAETGANPFRFGMIGSSDNHMALPGSVDEDNFWGYSPSSARVTSPYATVNWEMNAAGLAAVWAVENTREALFDAMRRKEVYASTGPRMTARFFGGWDFEPDDVFRHDLARIGYTRGVPMGGKLGVAPANRSPTFLIHVAKEPDGANLDRIQVIKGWYDGAGELHEKIFDVALSDGRQLRPDGGVEPVGNTVDVRSASYTNTIGDSELATVWRDPQFDRNEHAFYYVRALEIPTPRWTAYDARFYVAKFYSIDNLDEEIPWITQERVYTSPIWYSPVR